MKNNLKTVLLGILLLLSVFTGSLFLNSKKWNSWFPKNNKFQKAFNTERIKNGVLPIPLDWVTNDNGNGDKLWRPKKSSINHDSAVRISKLVLSENNMIVSELDGIGYFGKRKEKFQYVIEITYSYHDKKWKNVLTTYFDNQTYLDQDISMDIRDSILKSWHFDYEAHLKNWK